MGQADGMMQHINDHKGAMGMQSDEMKEHIEELAQKF